MIWGLCCCDVLLLTCNKAWICRVQHELYRIFILLYIRVYVYIERKIYNRCKVCNVNTAMLLLLHTLTQFFPAYTPRPHTHTHMYIWIVPRVHTRVNSIEQRASSRKYICMWWNGRRWCTHCTLHTRYMRCKKYIFVVSVWFCLHSSSSSSVVVQDVSTSRAT